MHTNTGSLKQISKKYEQTQKIWILKQIEVHELVINAQLKPKSYL